MGSCLSNRIHLIENPLMEIKLKPSINNLSKENLNKLKYFSWADQTFEARVVSVYDGDTFSACFIWCDKIIKWRCRSLGYDSAEMKPLLKNPNREHEKELAHKAKDRFTELLNANPNGLIRIKCHDFDKYGRILVTSYNDINTESINDIMIKEGHGKVYDGGKKDVNWDVIDIN